MDKNAATCQAYIEAVFARFQTPLDPGPRGIAWQDQLPHFKHYQQATRLTLPDKILDPAIPMADVWTSLTTLMREHRAMNFDEFTSILLLTYGLLNMRMELIWEERRTPLLSFHNVKYGRGTASGGGLYPAELYWVCGPGGPAHPGLYHYDPAHHALERVMSGNVTRSIQTAVFNHPAALATDQFLLLTVSLRKHTFKYKSFGYHVATQDLGALLGSFHFMSSYFQTTLQPLLWFQDEALNHLLGIDTLEESVFAVIPFTLVSSFLPERERFTYRSMATESDAEQDKPLILRKCSQSSQHVTRYPIIEEVHRVTLVNDAPRPNPIKDGICEEIGHADACILLPSPPFVHLQGNIGDAFRYRRSSFGRFSRREPLSRPDLAALLCLGAAAGRARTDLKHADGSSHFTRLAVFVNNVENVPPGAYIYDSSRHGLCPIRQGDFAPFLQENYQLENYNLAETAALITVIGNPTRMLEAYGSRGYRALNIEAGMTAQTIYLVATTLSLGCGAALGFDNLAMNEALGLAGTDLRSLLFIMVGHECQNHAGFNALFSVERDAIVE
jgi:SagB-type dehydrogenase family enzyme